MAKRKGVMAKRKGAMAHERIAVQNPATMLEIGPGSEAWTTPALGDGFEGAFVKVTPPATATDDAISALLDALASKRVRAAKLMPRVPGEALPLVAVERAPRRRHRDVVLGMLEGLPDAALLRDLCSSVMDEEGL